MYIYPNTRLLILNNVNLNSDYDHTIYFDGKVAQTEYFLGKKKFELTNQSYQRKERGWIQVDINQNSLWDCTYLMFQNTSYSNKWFYAFILSVDYVNDNVSKINFEIDVMQTWYFDYLLDKCFVEREHTTTDGLFENTVPEKIDIGEYYNVQIVQELRFSPSRLCVIASATAENVAMNPSMQGNIFTGLNYSSFDLSNSNGVRDAVEYLTEYISNGYEDNIIALVQYPNFIGRVTNITDYYNTTYTLSSNFVNVDGYVPKNKKLFCYPYNYASVTDKEGNSIDLKWEQWDSSYVGEFRIEASVFGKPCVSAIPSHYREIPVDYESSITYDNFPVCAWVGDAYQVWLAQNKGSIIGSAIGAVGSAIGATIAVSSGNLVSGASGLVSTVHQVANIIGALDDATRRTQKVHGNPSASTLNVQNGTQGFEFKQMTIRNEYARIIDEYFSTFGYACHRVKIPNRKARQKWTYTKTVACELSGNVPSDDIVKIKNVYNHGVTFWDIRYANVGEYGDFTNPLLS